MGWTEYHATHYKKGKVDRKAECDAYFLVRCKNAQNLAVTELSG